MIPVVTIITSNTFKIVEAKKALSDLPIVVKHEHLNDIDEIQSIDVETVCKKKAEDAYSIFKSPVIVDDTGLHIKNMNGFPGALVKFYEETVGLDEIAKRDAGSEAYAKIAIGYCDNNGPKVFACEINGTISKIPLGQNGFGWDNIFIPEHELNTEKYTFGQMALKDKLTISPRTYAYNQLKDYLKKIEN